MAIVKQINYSDLPDDIQSHIVKFSIPYDRESKLTKDIQTLNSLKKKLGKDVLNIFTTKENLFLDLSNKLEYREIYFLAKIFTTIFKTSVTKNIFFDNKIVFPLDNVKEILLNPTKTLYLTNNFRINNTNIHELGADTIVLFFNLLNDDLIYFQLKPINDDFFDFQLNFIFSCIAIIKRNGNIVLDFWPNTFTSEKYINGFKTIIHSLKQQNIPITNLSLWTDQISDEQQFALANALKINTTVKKISIKTTKYNY